MTELEIGFLFGCALLVCCVSLLIYLILDYRALCAATTFDAHEPLFTERRSRTTMPTPLYGERR